MSRDLKFKDEVEKFIMKRKSQILLECNRKFYSFNFLELASDIKIHKIYFALNHYVLHLFVWRN